jgi:UDP-3-O-[3-hydroxymyristoyl] N-acetylglucosamine deacetylase / 3-hydroxyacyl-[acyl-carrier-protein] dehydratase
MGLVQRTVSRQVTVDGQGLFSGERATLTISPAGPDSGISFIREQGDRRATIPALVQNIMKRPRRTSLRNGTLHVETIEHCMAAFSGLGVHNATVTLSGGITGELPAGDGSSAVFAEALAAAGTVEQDAPLSPLIISRPVHIVVGDRSITALPGPTDHLEIVYDLEAPEPVGRQIFAFRLGRDDFATQLAPARTFVFENEARELQARGMGRHLTPRDVLVIAASGPVENQFRFADECARHKVLDIVGDLYLAGRIIFGRIVAHKSGHEMNHLLVRRLLEQEQRSQREQLVGRDAVLDIRRIQRIRPHR